MADSQSEALRVSRRWVAQRARGVTLEIGVGAWPSLPYYQAGIDLTGLDVRPKAVAKARRTLTRSGRRATVVEGDAMALSFADASFDTVVFSFSLCGVPQVRGALLEALRVLRPGGALLTADHIVSTSSRVRGLQRLAEAFMRPMLGEHLTRRPSVELRELSALGVEIVEIERLSGKAMERVHAVKRA